MNGGNPVNWKKAVVPAVVLTAGLAFTIGHFAGGSDESGQQGGQAADFKFDNGPKYAPGSSPLARSEQQSGSSIELFRKVNEGYASRSAASDQSPARSRRALTKSELQEYMRQARPQFNMDPEALAAAAAAQEQQAQQQGGRGGVYGAARGGQGAGAAQAAAVRSSQPGSGGQAQAASGAAQGRRSAFGIGSSAGMSRGGPGARQPRSIDTASQSSTGESGGGYQASAGGGRDLSAGSYGSHGGGQSAAQAAQSQQNASSMAGGGKEDAVKRPPMPVAFIWPRSIDFGTMYNYETGVRLVIVMNIGDAPLKLGKIENMDDSTPFLLEKNSCTSVTLAPRKSCTFRVRFSPKSAKEYYTGFSVGSNDDGAMDYQTYIEVKGVSKYSYATWWWQNNWHGTAGYANRLEFSMVPEGYSMDEVLRVYNNSGETWHRIKLDTGKLPASFKITADGCSGQSLAPHQSCSATVNFVPDSATNRAFCPTGYGMYNSVNLTTGAKLLHSRPHFPPLVMESPVETLPRGDLRVFADYDEYYHNHQLVLTVPISGKSCATFPVYGLERVQHYYYFK